MEPVNWLAVLVAPALALAVGLAWHGPMFRTGRQLLPGNSKPTANFAFAGAVFLIGAAMLGHNFARIGPETLDAKPWLYFMQSGGIALAFVIPAVWLTHLRSGSKTRNWLVDCGFWLVAYLAMGTVFWALA